MKRTLVMTLLVAVLAAAAAEAPAGQDIVARRVRDIFRHISTTQDAKRDSAGRHPPSRSRQGISIRQAKRARPAQGHVVHAAILGLARTFRWDSNSSERVAPPMGHARKTWRNGATWTAEPI